MIRSFREADLDEVMSIWLNANREAHAFIDSSYWEGNFGTVKGMIPQAEVYVSEGDRGIDGFIGVAGSHIAGIFVDKSARARGIGGQLLDFAKRGREKLDLEVYEKNTLAIRFYRNRGFQIVGQKVDPQTSEVEYAMHWESGKSIRSP